MRALLIDPELKTVTSVDVKNHYKAFNDIIEAETGTVVQVNSKNDLWLDDDGLLNPTHFWQWKGSNQSFSGKGLLLGSTEDGGNSSTRVSIKKATEQITWDAPETKPMVIAFWGTE